MNIDTLLPVISRILAPVVMVTGCALFMNVFLQRYESIGTRLRLMHQELFNLLRTIGQNQTISVSDKNIDHLRLMEIEEQIPRLMRRYTMARNALLLVEVAGIVFVIDMFLIALAVFIRTFSPLAFMPLVGFLIGVTLLLISFLIAIFELFHSHREVTYEATHGLHVSRNCDPADTQTTGD